MNSRPTWDEYFLEVAAAVSARSDCRRSKVGAVLVDRSHRILATGYVGVAPGQPGCLAGACPRGLKTYDELPPYSDYSDCISTHAERNCADYAVKWYGSDYELSDTVMYITRQPCSNCLEYCYGVGISNFIYLYRESKMKWIRL